MATPPAHGALLSLCQSAKTAKALADGLAAIDPGQWPLLAEPRLLEGLRTDLDAVTRIVHVLTDLRQPELAVRAGRQALQRLPSSDTIVHATARALASAGRAGEGFELLRGECGKRSSWWLRAALLEFSARYGFFQQTGAEADRVLGAAGRECQNKWAIVSALAVLRLNGRYADYLAHAAQHAAFLADVRAYYVELANGLTLPDLLSAHGDDPNLHAVFACAAQQEHPAVASQSGALLGATGRVCATAPHQFGQLVSQLGVLAERVLDPDRRSPLATALCMMVAPQQVQPGPPAIAALNQLWPEDFRFIFGHRHGALQVARLIMGGLTLRRMARLLAPRALLYIDKLNLQETQALIERVVRIGLRRLCRSEELTDADRRALDPLVLRYRGVLGALADGYFARHPDGAALTQLPIVQRQNAIADAPRKVRGARRLRVAVCFSGQLRGYERAVPSVRERLLADVEPVVFVDTWYKVGRKTPVPAHAQRCFGGRFLQVYRETCTRLGFEAVLARYPLLTAQDDMSRVDPSSLAAFFGTVPARVRIEDDEAGAFRSWSNSQKMYYKILGAHRMMEASGEEFDLVLRIRPDKPVLRLQPRFNWHELADACNRGTLFADFESIYDRITGLMIGDQVALATPRLMAVYAHAADDAIAAASRNWDDWPKFLVGHTSLSHAAWINRIPVRDLPVHWEELRDPEPFTPEQVLERLRRDVGKRSADTYDQALLAAAQADLAGARG